MPGTPPLATFTRTREQLDAILTTRKGELRDTPYRLLLLAIGVREKSAVLRLRRSQLIKDVIFEGGAAIDCQSNIATETIGRFLVSTGRLEEEEYRSAMQASASRKTHIDDVLTERGLLTPSELYRALQQNLGRKLLEPFSWTSGTWEISYDVPRTDSALRVRIPQLLLTGTMKVEPQEVVEHALSGSEDEVIALSPDPLFTLDDVRISFEQQRVLDAAKERVATRHLAARTNVPAEDLPRIVCAFALLGLVKVDEARAFPPLELELAPVAPRVPAPAPAPPAVTASGNATPSPANAVAREEVIAAYLSFRRKDAFELFGIEGTASPAEITRAYLAFAERFLPARFSDREPDGVREKAQDVFLAGARAYAELADPLRRETLLQQRARKAANAAAAAEDTAARAESTASRRQLIDPEALWREGREHLTRGRLREALSNFELAADCDAQNATYAAEVAWCRFQLMISPAPLALKALKNAIRLDPRCAVAYLYAGRVQKTIGNELEAQAYLDRAERLMPARRPQN